MSSLWLIMLLMLLVAVVFVLLATGRQRRYRKRQDENQRWYEQRLAELEEERSQYALPEEEYRHAKQELDKTFLKDSENVEESIHWHRTPIVTPILLLVIISSVLYWAFGSWQLQLQAENARERLPELGKSLLQQNQQGSPEEINTFALGLRQKLMNNPDDPIAWWIYAGLMVDLGAVDDANEAFQKSLQLAPDSVNTLVSYSRFLLMSGVENGQSKAAQLLARALQQEPGNIEALSLLGFVAFERQDWDQAISAWQLLKERLADGSERYQAVANALERAKEQKREAQIQLQVTVKLSEDLRNQLPANAVLFVYVTGKEKPMPAAVVRQPAGEFPVTITLSNQNAMLPDYQMSDLDYWQIHARVSQDEKIERQAGDLEADTVTIKADSSTDLTLTLSTRIDE
ncbi:c-type cytochrome biogenesis protein CcmI [Idiomarina sp. HP20-50]|uniref:c-type cytochrome biogenesis protein CcmI n=1 Tax=Idiomarina sp. HP20-50 TaxID=3070813 RepID=UPI00294AD586|nr:c-type cytochrome biogenesis protein CcmI [Idiomarina sp. HP20-50]MDV6316927.1 c-type cytochrome biogenesis protein CcmI [Idiomarina sp. HP20-50]